MVAVVHRVGAGPVTTGHHSSRSLDEKRSYGTPDLRIGIRLLISGSLLRQTGRCKACQSWYRGNIDCSVRSRYRARVVSTVQGWA